MRGLPLSGLAIALGVLMVSCSSAQDEAVDPPVAPQGNLPQSALANEQQAARSYDEACGVCHDNNEFAVRVLADRLGPEKALIHKGHNLEPEAIRAIVRNGMGSMPAMSKLEVTDAELDSIIAYLGETRNDRQAGGPAQ